ERWMWGLRQVRDSLRLLGERGQPGGPPVSRRCKPPARFLARHYEAPSHPPLLPPPNVCSISRSIRRGKVLESVEAMDIDAEENICECRFYCRGTGVPAGGSPVSGDRISCGYQEQGGSTHSSGKGRLCTLAEDSLQPGLGSAELASGAWWHWLDAGTEVHLLQ